MTESGIENARAESMLASKSFADLQFGLIQVKKRSTPHRRGNTAKPI